MENNELGLSDRPLGSKGKPKQRWIQQLHEGCIDDLQCGADGSGEWKCEKFTDTQTDGSGVCVCISVECKCNVNKDCKDPELSRCRDFNRLLPSQYFH